MFRMNCTYTHTNVFVCFVCIYVSMFVRYSDCGYIESKYLKQRNNTEHRAVKQIQKSKPRYQTSNGFKAKKMFPHYHQETYAMFLQKNCHLGMLPNLASPGCSSRKISSNAQHNQMSRTTREHMILPSLTHLTSSKPSGQK